MYSENLTETANSLSKVLSDIQSTHRAQRSQVCLQNIYHAERPLKRSCIKAYVTQHRHAIVSVYRSYPHATSAERNVCGRYVTRDQQ